MRSTARPSLDQRRRLREVLEQRLRRSSAGESIDDDAIVAAHPDLMPALAGELRLLRILERAGQRARVESDGSGSNSGSSFGRLSAQGLSLPQINGYRLQGEIHRGGQGVVFKAVQESTRRTVAVKVQREGAWAREKDRARFEREVDILASLRHPNIVTIHDKGTAAGATYFVMDFIDGVPLDEYVGKIEPLTSLPDVKGRQSKNRKVEMGELLKLFVKVCDAVHAAHLRGVIHRDIKPSNVLVNGAGEPFVLDFGLAKDVSATGAVTITAEGQFVGSLPWASPEQAEGRADAVDVRSDVYALGVMLYQALAGGFPYDVTGTMRDVVERIVHAEPIRLRKKRAARLIDADLETIVLRCLHKEPQRRYQSAGELGRDLGHYLAGDPVEARRDSGWYVLRKTLSRRRGTVAALAAIILALALGVVGTIWQAVRAGHERDQAAEQALRARQTADLLKRVIRSATPEMAQGTSPTVREMLDAASGDLEHDESVHPLVAADTHGALADAYYSLGEYVRAEVHSRRALELHTAHQGPRHPEALEAAGDLVIILSRLDRDEEAVATARQALDAARAELGPDHPASIGLALNYAFALTYTTSPDQAEVIRWTREGYERSADVLGKEDPHTLRAATDLSVTLMEAGQLDEAEALLRSVLETRQRNLGDDHPDVLVSLSNLAAILDRREDMPGAIELLLRVLERADRILGPDHPRTCRYANNLAMLNAQLGRWEEAELYARRAMAAAARLGPAHHDVLKYRGLLATALIELKRVDEAQPLVEEQNDLCVKELGAKHPDTLEAITLQFDLAKAQGRLDQMRHWAEELRGTQWEEAVFKQIEAVEAAAAAGK